MRKIHSLRKGIRKQTSTMLGISDRPNRIFRRSKAIDSAGVEISRLPERHLGVVDMSVDGSEGYTMGLDGLGEVPLA